MNINKDLTQEQRDAFDAFIEFLGNPHRPYFIISGFAGTGKTYLLREITRFLKEDNTRIAFAAYTGKAASIIKKNVEDVAGSSYIGTIHGLIYRPEINTQTGEIEGWEKIPKLDVDIIIIDEGSMIDKELLEDLLSYKLPVLITGDHGQLPPISNSGFSIMNLSDVFLKTIHRQALESPIIKLSQLARNGERIPFGNWDNACIKVPYSEDRIIKYCSKLANRMDSQVLCGTNKTRVLLTNQIRKVLGYKNDIPHPGEKLICLKNNKKENIMNGSQGIMTRRFFNKKLIRMEVEMEESGVIQEFVSPRELLNNLKPSDVFRTFAKRKEINYFDFGYVITVHKSQGSQYTNVILIDEKMGYQSTEMYNRWIYTSITRACERLFIFKR